MVKRKKRDAARGRRDKPTRRNGHGSNTSHNHDTSIRPVHINNYNSSLTTDAGSCDSLVHSLFLPPRARQLLLLAACARAGFAWGLAQSISLALPWQRDFQQRLTRQSQTSSRAAELIQCGWNVAFRRPQLSVTWISGQRAPVTYSRNKVRYTPSTCRCQVTALWATYTGNFLKVYEWEFVQYVADHVQGGHFVFNTSRCLKDCLPASVFSNP